MECVIATVRALGWSEMMKSVLLFSLTTSYK